MGLCGRPRIARHRHMARLSAQSSWTTTGRSGSARLPQARLAVLHYRVLDAGPCGSWLEIRPGDRATHQVRIQAASRGHPLLGDAQYGSKITFGQQYEDQRCEQSRYTPEH